MGARLQLDKNKEFIGSTDNMMNIDKLCIILSKFEDRVSRCFPIKKS